MSKKRIYIKENVSNSEAGEGLKNTGSDLMFLLGYKKGTRHSKFEMIKIEAQNAWLDGKNADENPYSNTQIDYRGVWGREWRLCNMYC